MHFNDKVVVVTGAASGIGEAAAAMFREHGAIVYAVDRDFVDADLKAAPSQRAGYERRVDVTSVDEWSRLAAELNEQHGCLDILVNCAGVIELASIEDSDFEVFERIWRINFGGVLLAMKAMLPLLKRTTNDVPHAVVINLGSVAAYGGGDRSSPYSVSKASVRSISNCAALEFARKGYRIRVNAIHPGTIESNMTQLVGATTSSVEEYWKERAAAHPVGRFGVPADVVHAIRYLADDDASFVTGMDLRLDGGRSAVTQ